MEELAEAIQEAVGSCEDLPKLERIAKMPGAWAPSRIGPNSVRHSICLLPLPAHPKTSCKSDMFNIYLTCALLAPRAF